MDVDATSSVTVEAASRRWVRLLQATPWVPVYIAIVVLFFLSHWIVGPDFSTLSNFWSIVTLGSWIAVASAGQGLVILTGGIDLSIPWVITLAGILTTRWTNGVDGPLAWVLPAVLLLGAGVGAVNGLGVMLLGISPVVFTIAMNSIIEGVVLVVTGGTPKGQAPSLLKHAMNNSIGGSGVPVIAVLLAGFAIVASLYMSKTTAGKRTYAVGNSQLVARLSGVRVGWVVVGVYAISGLTASLTGIMLTGYASQSYLGMGDSILLPSIAAVVIGGASILGGRGHYLGSFGGAIFLSLLTAVLTSMSLTDAARSIIFGCVILLAIVAVRERAASQ